MSEVTLRRHTYKGEEFAIKLELDDALPWSNTTPRTVDVLRIYSEGNLDVLRWQKIKHLTYSANGNEYTFDPKNGHIDQSLAGFGLQVRVYTDVSPKTGEVKRWVIDWTGVHGAEMTEATKERGRKGAGG